MTLRLRLALFYTLLVALVLGVSGTSLHFLFQQSLQTGLDSNLTEASQLIIANLEEEEHEHEHEEEGFDFEANSLSLSSELIILLFNSSGKLIDNIGKVPSNTNDFLQNLGAGFSTKDEWRILVLPVFDRKLVLIRSKGTLIETLGHFDRLFLFIVPLTLVSAFILGYLLAGRALHPVNHLTRAAYDLAKRRAWREALPEPNTKDELWRLAKATNTLLASLSEVIETERRFTANAAHELRTPLTVLQGRLEQALEQTKETNTQERLNKAHQATSELLNLVQKLLLLARTEAGQGLHPEKLAIDEVAFDTAEELRPLFIAKGVELELNLPEIPIYIQGDRIALGLLIRNLLDNSLKFTSNGKVCLSVKQSKNVELVVEDNGTGIPEKALPHLFERFYQAKASHRRNGSGLGLALVKSITDWHGGSINASNLNDGGTRFCLYLPYMKLGA